MTSFSIPVIAEVVNRQRRAARLLHLLAAFLMVANAWGDFQQPSPGVVFLLVQISAALLTLLFVVAGKQIFSNPGRLNGIFRLLQAVIFFYASRYFFNHLNLSLMGTLQLIAGIGLLLLFFQERSLFVSPVVAVSEKGVQVPKGTGHRHLAWTEVEDMRIRNDFVSINTRSNEFIQFETGAVLGETEMDEQNEFCRQHFATVPAPPKIDGQ